MVIFHTSSYVNLPENKHQFVVMNPLEPPETDEELFVPGACSETWKRWFWTMSYGWVVLVIYLNVNICFSPNNVSTLKGSYNRCKGRCLIRVLTLGPSSFPVSFRKKWLLWNVQVHFDCADSHKVWSVVLARHFPCIFPCKMASACRLRRLARSVWSWVLGRGIFPVNLDIKRLLWNVEMHFDCAGPHKVWLWVAAFFLSISIYSGSCETLSAFRLRRPAQAWS